MFILRKVSKQDLMATNIILGSTYKVFYSSSMEDQEWEDLLNKKGFNQPEGEVPERKIKAFIYGNELLDGLHPLSNEQNHYVMTSEGKTFERLYVI